MTALFRRALILGVTTCALVATPLTAAHADTAPAPPTGLTAKTTSSTAVITWKKAANATKYRVCLQEFRGQNPCYRLSDKITARSIRFTGLKPTSGRDYYVKVYSYRTSSRAVSAALAFDLSAPEPPAPPADVTHKIGAATLAVSWKPSARATEYAVCLMTRSTTETCSTTSARGAATTATFTGLRPTVGADYYFRVYAYRGALASRSAKTRVDLPVAAVATVTAARSGSRALAATWAPARNAENYQLQLATNAAMTAGLKTFTITTTTAEPAGLTPGVRYYFRVRGLNGVVKGAFSPVGNLRLPTEATTINVLTYNLCGQDKCVSKANKMKKWSTRKTIAGQIVRSTGAGIIATQESHDDDTKFGSQLPGFGLAAYYSAKSLFYDKAKYSVVRSGRITLDAKNKKYAVWAEFRDKVAQTEFIVADVHLQPYKGKTKDNLRAAQTTVLLDKIAKANTADLPVVYAGDFNSNKSNSDQKRFKGGYDAPLRIFTKAGIPDTYETVVRPSNAIWNSANQASNSPLYRNYDHVDHIFADREIAVRSWRVVIALDGKRYATPFATDHNPIQATLTIPGR